MTPNAEKSRRPLHTPPVAASLFPHHPGSMLSVLDFSLEELSHILARATALENQDPLTRARILAKRRIALLFYESSTRTRTSFELAAKGLGADTTLVSSLSSSIEKGETLKDTGLTLRALGAEAIILRHPNSGAAWLLEAETRLPVLNGGDGMHEHPTQALLDLRTMLAHLRPGIRDRHRRNPLRRHRHHHRRHSAQPRRPLEYALAAASGRARHPLRPQGSLAGGGRAGRPRHHHRTRLRGRPRPVAGGDDAAHSGRAAGRNATRPRRVQGRLPARRPAPRHFRAQSAGPPSRPHHSRPGDHRRRSRRPAIGDPRTGPPRRSHPHGRRRARADWRRQIRRKWTQESEPMTTIKLGTYFATALTH